MVDGEIDENSGSSGGNANAGGGSDEPADGRDEVWNRRMKEKLERMQKKNMKDMSISVTQKSGLSGALASRQRKTFGDDGDKVSGQGKIREELSRRSGIIQFKTGDVDGTVDICVQSITANKNSPSRIMLSISMEYTEVEDDASGDESGDEAAARNLEKSEVKTQMTRLERDFQTLTSRVKAILKNADYTKDQEVAFHEQSVAMNRAAMYWPIIQLVVILVTGVTQVNHIVGYMKAHHIGV